MEALFAAEDQFVNFDWVTFGAKTEYSLPCHLHSVCEISEPKSMGNRTSILIMTQSPLFSFRP